MTSEAEKKKKREREKSIRLGIRVIDILGLLCICGIREEGRVEFAFSETDDTSFDLFKKWIEKIFIVKEIEMADAPAMPDNAPLAPPCSSDSSPVEVKEGQVVLAGSRYNYISLQQAAFDRLVDYALWLELETHNKNQRETEPIFNISDVTFVLLMVVGGALMATGFAFFPGLFLVTLGGLGFAGSVFLSSKPAPIIQDVVSIGNTEIDKLYKRRKRVIEAIDCFSLLDIYDKSNLAYCGFEYELGKEGKEECIKLFFENNLEINYFKKMWFSGIDPNIKYTVEEGKGRYVIKLEGENCDKFVSFLDELQTQKLGVKASIHLVSAKLVCAVAALLSISVVVLTFIAPAIGLQMTVVSGLLFGGAYWVVGPGAKGNDANPKEEAKPTESKICGWLKKLHIDEVNFMRFSIAFAGLTIVAGAVLIATGFGLVTGLPMMIFGIASLPGPALFIRNARVISVTSSVRKRSGSFNGKTLSASVTAPAPVLGTTLASPQSVGQPCDSSSVASPVPVSIPDAPISTRARSNSISVQPSLGSFSASLFANTKKQDSESKEQQAKVVDEDEVNCRPRADSGSPGSSPNGNPNSKRFSCISPFATLPAIPTIKAY